MFTYVNEVSLKVIVRELPVERGKFFLAPDHNTIGSEKLSNK